jgi:anti-anti-sigma factor
VDKETGEISFDRAGRNLTAYLSGEIDAENAPSFSDQITEQTRPDDETVWLDMSEVTFCASAGVSLIMRAHNEAAGRDARMVLYCPSAEVLHTLEMCKVTKALKIRTS